MWEKNARIRYITRTYGKDSDLLVIENIPVISCSFCGESYLTAATLHKIEQIKLHSKDCAGQCNVLGNVPVAAFA